MFKILTLDNISPLGLARLPKDQFQVSSDMKEPDGILLRSFKMHDMEIPKSLKAVGRAGAGVNNIPVEKLTRMGIPVFNAPGANANAVKELVLAGMLLACRHIPASWEFARGLSGSDPEISKAVEAGKKNFAGFELPGRTLAVIGLGAIGRSVANMGIALGMKVIGFDPGLTVEGAWQLSADVKKANSVEEALRAADFVTFHVPFMESTKNLINAERLKFMKDGVIILNFAREGIVDDAAVSAAIKAGKVYGYVCDFPSNLLKNHERVITLPHLGASTAEAEDNCAIMVAEQAKDFLQNGNIRNAVNYPDVVAARETAHRLVVANANVPNMLGLISETLGHAKLNIHDMINRSRGDYAYTVVDLDSPVPEGVRQKIAGINGVLMARII
ncbi:MAG: 3-phosphoglycerate dehydrogenase [Candidatus Muproteobacteria bacterium RIFCSPHIGHO2_12_FULL_60_33]|uniref:3-phosphoglycerate dehydrogenase n=1 Tax=Candidatus Muproteobacteria bacterium RIFCSPLOWO2_01_FULL_60_18 TaxID=1817768 RepID=A0A1F6TYT7_9PROT|nr:MAG: 3-phosphoglycerate dehydrogenase [Candidatus Muproteobacteria bacterium RIFCSPHIGHO2_01_60_12]OGI50304.1 MAG: 3-phosphoglycerate dehydrogenase [Candidatus Muproteobacteria bacterium RIFCSPLOWO2_01_FULL_60_18]OGI53985.1 MAG: 3-phosphoglycerate dehydrogenase [Candidatus Muproteobacteria bacterium RIFCSPHIGHO2_12_FULL_60_33]OGI54155.1 MAG: 3-phosphoglycerate dehydrogenase [Candidatus Muproteobacteria bacterium RIFCSPHIGHO2_02_FULL_60_13]OGI59234.1 MAG: 3-phosphoglycerate dehydrogenase [Can